MISKFPVYRYLYNCDTKNCGAVKTLIDIEEALPQGWSRETVVTGEIIAGGKSHLSRTFIYCNGCTERREHERAIKEAFGGEEIH